MAKVPPKPSGKGMPPESGFAAGNLDKPERDDSATLNFKVSEAFKREFKIRAATDGVNLNRLLREAFEAYKTKNSGQ